MCVSNAYQKVFVASKQIWVMQVGDWSRGVILFPTIPLEEASTILKAWSFSFLLWDFCTIYVTDIKVERVTGWAALVSIFPGAVPWEACGLLCSINCLLSALRRKASSCEPLLQRSALKFLRAFLALLRFACVGHVLSISTTHIRAEGSI